MCVVVGIDVSTTVYRAAGGFDLNAHVFSPRGGDERPAAVFFHGGGLSTGAPDGFFPECEHLASRGMVAATVAYRLLPDQARHVGDCIADACAAVAWIRSRDGVDAGRIVACGYSAGGWLAASAALEEPMEQLAASCRPDVLILLSTVVNTAWFNGTAPKSSLPPTLMLHGSRDTMAPVGRARRFAHAMTTAGSRCELAEFDGAHTFFRPMAKNGSGGFIGALSRIDAFLTDLGYLPSDASAARRIEELGEAMLADVLDRRAKRKRRSPGQ